MLVEVVVTSIDCYVSRGDNPIETAIWKNFQDGLENDTQWGYVYRNARYNRPFTLWSTIIDQELANWGGQLIHGQVVFKTEEQALMFTMRWS